ncbi:MAG: S-layer homology domain-containing protein [Tissierellia bacterium]|nr:S-layer homology domain-containing protein [Tissierellia bacterium]
MKKTFKALILCMILSWGSLWADSKIGKPKNISGAIVPGGYELTVKNAKEILQGKNLGKVYFEIDVKNNGKWSSEDHKEILKDLTDPKENSIIQITQQEVDQLLPHGDNYTFRVRYLTDIGRSPYSYEISLGHRYIFHKYSSWAKNDLVKAQKNKLISSDVQQNMKSKISREELAEIVVKVYQQLHDNTSQGNKNHFVDSTNQYVNIAYDLGLMNGVGNRQFEPKKTVTRQDYALVLTNLFQLKEQKKFHFSDEKNVAEYAREAVEKTLTKKLLHVNEKNQFNPLREMSREEVLSSIVRNI